MKKSFWAKALAWVGAAISTLALNGAFGKYSAAAGSLGAVATALATHHASDTSADNPAGK
jgi:hypothetical protein